MVLEFPSNGATENLLTAAVLAKGTTVIENAAREPEIVELAAMLNRMGAQVFGAGTPTIEIVGVDELVPVTCELMGDRIETGTLLMACGIAGGEIRIEGARIEHVDLVATKLGEMGIEVSPTPTGICARADDRVRAVDIVTLPFPGFATDFMPIAVALLATADGTAIVTENVFDNRFGFVAELNRMGADVRHEGRHAIVRGVDRLSGAPVRALDVRAGAALGARGPRRRRRDGRARSPPRGPWLHRPRRLAARPRGQSGADQAGGLIRATSERGRAASPRCGKACDTGGVEEETMSTDTALEPAEMHQQVQDAIELIRPALQSDGGDIVLREVDADGVVHVTLVGACGTCPISMQTLKAGVERIIMDRVPGVTGVTDDVEE